MRNRPVWMHGLFAVALCGLFSAHARADEAAPAQINVYPTNAKLTTNRDRQSFIVQAVYPNGITRDVTAEAAITPADAALLKLEGPVIHPIADGTTELNFEYAGLKVTVPVEVQQATADRPISFKLDIMPVFMKSGCNTGSCHGAARGKDGFPPVAVRIRSATGTIIA